MKRLLIILTTLAILTGMASAQKISKEQAEDQDPGTINGRAIDAGVGPPQSLPPDQIFDILGISQFVRTLFDDLDAAAFRETIGAGTGNGTVTGVTGTTPIAVSQGAAPVISLDDTVVTPGSYTNTNLTVDQKGRITAASNGVGGGGYSDEQAQDAVGNIFVDSPTVDFTYTDATPSVTASVIGTVTTVTGTAPIASSGGTTPAISLNDDGVTNTKLANVPTATFKGRTTAATGDPEDLTVAEAKTLLNLTGTNSGDQTITLTSDVTGTGTGSFATTIAANAVTNTKLADMVQATIKGRAATAGTGDPTDLTGAQVAAITNTSLDHGLLLGLTDDDHVGYARLAGRAGSQVLNGGTAASESLTLASTSNATRGEVILIGNTRTAYTFQAPTIYGSSVSGGDLTLDSTSDVASKGFVRINPAGGNVSIGTSIPLYTFDIRGVTTGSQIHFSGSADDGGYLSSGGIANANFSAGTALVAGAWVAKNANATIVAHNAGDVSIYNNTGLTVGASFTPTQRAVFDATGTFSVFNNTDVTRSFAGALTSSVVNANAGAGTYASLEVRNGAAAQDGARLMAFGTAYGGTAGSAYVTDTVTLEAGSNISGGLALSATAAAGDMHFFTGGFAAANERARIESAGHLLTQELAAPATPASGFGAWYVTTAGIPRFKNDSGLDVPLVGSDTATVQGGNMIANFPVITNQVQDLEWWLEQDVNVDLASRDAASVSIPDTINKNLLQVITGAAGAGHYVNQRLYLFQHDILDNGNTISAGIWVYQTAASTVTFSLVGSVAGTLGTATTTALNTWTELKIENKVVGASDTWVDIRMTSSANSHTSYWTDPQLVLGPVVRPWEPNPIELVNNHVSVISYDPSGTAWFTRSYTSQTHGLAFAIGGHVRLDSATAVTNAVAYMRPSFSSAAVDTTTAVARAHVVGVVAFGDFEESCSDAQQIDESVGNFTNVTGLEIAVTHYYRWVY